ncbi:MAG: glycosyltransferase family 87 protein [Steroidobacteraceae bacterium]
MVSNNPLSEAIPRERRGPAPLLAALRRTATSPRFYVYLSCVVLAVLTNYRLGKELLWDTMDYHIYAGFSALHDRFGQDYFAAGPQGYFNPYAYVPFYLLLRSKLTVLEDASILAALQSVILWLTFELGLLVAPRDQPRARLAVAILATVFAFANPILINELGSSYADITTAEVALAGWLVLANAIRSPSGMRVLCAALLLGVASALKLTNAVHAVSAAALLLFIPEGWRSRFRYAVLFATGGAVGFVLVSAPWSLRLEQHFGNPLFPLLNGLFRSPEFTIASIQSYRFIPSSLGAALLLPFAMIAPVTLVDVEWTAPDTRYALLLVLLFVVLLQQMWRRRRKREIFSLLHGHDSTTRVLAALACGFLLDWTLWLTASGNGRYFIPMACVAAVLGVALIFRIFAAWPKAGNYLLAAILGVQFFQLYAGTEYRAALPWTRQWFSVSLPTDLASHPNLYFTIGTQTDSFLLADLPAGSGFVNLDGDYVLAPSGPNATRVASLVERYGSHLRVLVRDPRADAGWETSLSNPTSVDDALDPFGLKVDASRCSRLVVRGVTVPWFELSSGHAPRPRAAPEPNTEYFLACGVDRLGSGQALPFSGKRAADLALDHLEDACPALFQPARPDDIVGGDEAHGYIFTRKYTNTDTVAWVGRGSLWFVRLLDPEERHVGPEGAWEGQALRVVCGRQGQQGYFRVLEQ